MLWGPLAGRVGSSGKAVHTLAKVSLPPKEASVEGAVFRSEFTCNSSLFPSPPPHHPAPNLFGRGIHYS